LKLQNFIGYQGPKGLTRITISNLVKICQSIVEILQFFDFSRWRPSAVLDLFVAYSDHQQGVLRGLCHSAKFGYDRCSSFYSIFGVFGCKMTIHAPKIGVSEQFVPLSGLQYQRKPKQAHPCMSSRYLSHQA